MDNLDRSTQERLEAIRRRARDSERSGRMDPGSRIRGAAAVTTWRPLGRGPVDGGGRGDASRTWSPRAEVFDRDGSLVVRLELPGVERSDVEVAVNGDRLIVEGDRREERSRDERGVYESEWAYGRFFREIELPEPVDPADVSASYRNGVLEVEVPRKRRAERRKEVTIET